MLSACAHELTAMRNQLSELGYEVGGASILRGDNTSSIMAAKNPGQHRSQLRHLELHAFAVRDLVREQQVDLMWCPTDENPSDLLTKAIASPSKFQKFQSVLLGECARDEEGGGDTRGAGGQGQERRCALFPDTETGWRLSGNPARVSE